MKRLKKIVIGGIQSKIFNLILVTVLLLTAAYMAVSLYHSHMLSDLAEESGEKQQESISATTNRVMDQVVKLTMERSNRMEADIADGMFDNIRKQVTFLGLCTEHLFAHPEEAVPGMVALPDEKDDGKWTVKVIYAEGVDESDPLVAEKTRMIAGLSDVMLSLCSSYGASDAYIALPEGVFLCADNVTGSWFADGQLIRYDARERGWYQRAAEAGSMIFTDGEWDANTGAYCVECAMPVYGPEGELRAVVGMDLYLNDMQQVMQNSAVEGEYRLLVNQAGKAVLLPQAEAFPMAEEDRESDLRLSENAFLSRAVSDALAGKDTGVQVGGLRDGTYYVTATPIETTGWMLLSAFSQAVSGQPTEMLTDNFASIERESLEEYQEKTGKSRTTATVLLAAVMVLTLTGALVLGKRIVKPLNTITRRVSELSDTHLEFKMEDAYRTGDEVEELAQSFANLSHRTVIHIITSTINCVYIWNK